MRLFVALPLPPPAKDAAAAAMSALERANPDARWVPKHNLHVTLAFLGRTSFVDAVTRAAAEAVRGFAPLRLRLDGLGAFPDERRARVLWVGLAGDVEPLAAMAAAVGRSLEPLGFEPDAREFSPHATIARMRMPATAALDATVEPVEWTATEATLYESVLRRSGPVYTTVADFPLSGPA